uniref:Phosphate regulon sensor protein PhoR n=1 Tax=Candidatus Kentrum sp. DK TaxID=2126562 RepID=A0A450SJT0_9GAMM|nr:MAG: PAS/PAC sensor signal transduction histidine kinase [Candidatus Kentron sp. DK]
MFSFFADNGLVREALAVLTGGLAAGFLGFSLGAMPVFLCGFTVAYLVWHLFQLHRLRRWLGNPQADGPLPAGIWRGIAEGLRERLRAGAGSTRKGARKGKRKLNWVVKKFNESVSGLSDAAVLLDQDDGIAWWNGPATGLLGIGRTDDRGKRITHLIRHPEFVGQLQGQRRWRGPLEIPSPVDPDVRLTILVVPAGKNKRLLQARDSTRVYRLEQTRRDFVANVSHELRTPLTVINGYVETLLERDDAKALSWYPALSKIYQQTERMGKIVADLLLLSRLELRQEQRQREYVPVAAMLEGIGEEALTLSGDSRHEIVVRADPGPGLHGNPQELRSAFSNLVFNAVRYTPAGGKITVHWSRDDEGGRLLVRDTGIGIDARHLSRITERFYRVDTGRSRESGGTGLGLTIVKHVLTRHDATLSIESTPGKGSDFVCRFPPERLLDNGEPNQ